MTILNKSESEFWRALPGVPGVEVSTLGKIRTLDRLISSETMTRFTKGRVLKQRDNGKGYLQVNISIDEKQVTKKVHRLVAQTFIKNPDNLPEINHKDSDPTNNNVSNLEWCSHSYNQNYREKYGISATESLGHPVFAVNLTTLKVYRFRSQREAGRALGVDQSSIFRVIKGKQKQSHGYWFVNDDGYAVIKSKDDKHILTEDEYDSFNYCSRTKS